MQKHNILPHIFENGLQLILNPVPNTPIVSHWVWYRVGNRNEQPGLTGLSHWVEHLMFKGTPTYPRGSMFRQININGGLMNAFTSRDYTAYYEVLPADRLSLALHIESDRMLNAQFNPADVQTERGVILAEREGYENSPGYLLKEALNAAAYSNHPYGQPIIGWKSDLHTIDHPTLWKHYQTYYGPHNAVIIIAGAIEPDDLWPKLTEIYGNLPAGPPPPPVLAVEPPQLGERRVSVRQGGGVPRWQAAFHVPAAQHPDIPALWMLDAVLSGASSMSVMGGQSAQTHRTARLYQKLVKTQIALRAGSGFRPALDPGLFNLLATPTQHSTLTQVETAMFAEIDRLQQNPLPAAELARVLKQTQAQFAYAMEHVSNQAYWLGLMEIWHSWERLFTLLDDLQAITPADIQRVAQRYLHRDNVTIGVFEPR